MIYKSFEHLELPGLSLFRTPELEPNDSALRLETQQTLLPFPSGSQADIIQGATHGKAFRQESRFVKKPQDNGY